MGEAVVRVRVNRHLQKGEGTAFLLPLLGENRGEGSIAAPDFSTPLL
jgi:hypothetical protein